MDPVHDIPWLGVADPVAAGTHLVGAFAALASLVPLWRRSEGKPRLRMTAIVYAASMAISLGASTAYHTAGSEPLKGQLRHLDHAMIYVLIAGTYTPIVGNLVRDRLRPFMLWTVWVLAALGIANKTLFFGRTPEWLDTTMFLVMGWFGVAALPQIARACTWRAALLMPLAGIIYSAGALCELFGWPNLVPGIFGFHEVFHMAVLGGCACFYLFVYAHVCPNALPDAPGKGAGERERAGEGATETVRA